MIILRFFLLLWVIPLFGYGQAGDYDYYLSNQPRFLNQFNDTLPNAFTGGLRNPQVYKMDLNKDGIDDLIVFDGYDKSLLPFVGRKSDGEIRYNYEPSYEAVFPFELSFEALKVRDYNDDGLSDLFYNTGGDLAVYKQTQPSDTLSFKLVTEELMARDVVFCPDTCESRIFTAPTDIPGIADVDKDGDLDILTFSSTYLTYYRNMAAENPDLTKDSLSFELTDGCWGSFRESGSDSKTPNININCPDFRRAGKKHKGSNILLMDKEGDDDTDLLYADIGSNKIVLLENGKKETNYFRDSLITADSEYPESKPVDLQEFLSPFLQDVNGDSLKDLIVTPQEEVNGKTKNQLWYYKNTGSSGNPEFTYQGNDFLQRTMLDLGGPTSPTFFDYDGDDVEDLLIATSRNTGNVSSTLVLYENKGTNERPVYEKANGDYLNLANEDLLSLTPAAGDLNGDGATDLVIGNSEGKLRYYENKASPDKEATFELVSKQLDSLDVGRGSAPALADINGDGRMDLLVGTSYRDLFYYRQKGNSGGKPAFTKVTDTFGGIQKNRFSYPAPRITDLNQNGTLDLLLGTENSGIKVYEDFEPLVGKETFPEKDIQVFSPSATEKNVDKLGSFLKPAIHQQGPDSLPDIMVGNGRGGLIFLGTNPTRDTIDDNTSLKPAQKTNDKDYKVFPNPTSDYLKVELLAFPETQKQLTFNLRNLKGQLVQQSRITSHKGTQQIRVSSLTPGVYISTMQDRNGSVIGRKRVVITP